MSAAAARSAARHPLRPVRAGAALLTLLAAVGGELQAASWEVDQAHTSIIFYVAHFDLARSVGRFNHIEGNFEIDPEDPAASRAEVRIRTDSLDMGDAGFTRAMLGEDWFDAEAHPYIHFDSETVHALDDGRWRIDGRLRLRDSSQPVSLMLQRYRCATPPMTGRFSCGYSLTAELNRSDFGLDRFPRWVGQQVTLHIEIELQREHARGRRKR